jgi:FixJ family two-component response regulator
MSVERSLVSIIDDDVSVRESLPDMLSELGYSSVAFSSAEEFLASAAMDQTGCLLLDIALPGISGPDLQKELIRQGREIPIIFITAKAQAAFTLRTLILKQGAVDCLYKPFSEANLASALNAAQGDEQ